MSDLDKLIKNKALFRVLVVDDKPNMRRTIRNMLRTLGLNNFVDAEDGEAALKKVRSEKLDFVICDWNMPRMNGVEFLRATREDPRFSKLPFLMITAEVEEGTVAESIEAEVDGYIIKPFLPKTLEETMAEILKQKMNPSPMDTHLRVAEVQMEGGNFESAHKELDQAEKIAPRSPKVHYTRGLIYEAENKMEEAEKAFVAARRYGPKFIRSHEKLAQIYEAQGRKSERLQVIKEAVKVSPKNAERQTTLGEALLSEGRIQEAKQAFNLAIQVDPDNPARKTNIGEIYLSHGLSQEAEKAFLASIKANPADVYVYNRLGIAFRRQKKFDEAIQYYLKALKIDPTEQNLMYNLARAYLGTGQKAEAAKALRMALKVNPDFAEAKRLLDKIQGG